MVYSWFGTGSGISKGMGSGNLCSRPFPSIRWRMHRSCASEPNGRVKWQFVPGRAVNMVPLSFANSVEVVQG
jgi:hypothetical protein